MRTHSVHVCLDTRDTHDCACPYAKGVFRVLPSSRVVGLVMRRARMHGTQNGTTSAICSDGGRYALESRDNMYDTCAAARKGVRRLYLALARLTGSQLLSRGRGGRRVFNGTTCYPRVEHAGGSRTAGRTGKRNQLFSTNLTYVPSTYTPCVHNDRCLTSFAVADST